MPCGKRPLVKTWDTSKNIRIEKPSRYQQNEASVKVHWRKVIKDLEGTYQDEGFWESQSGLVRNLVGPVIFERLTKIFDLPQLDDLYEPKSEPSTVEPSEQFYTTMPMSTSKIQFGRLPSAYSLSEYSEVGEEMEELSKSQSTIWTLSSTHTASMSEVKTKSRSKITLGVLKKPTVHKTKSFNLSFSKLSSKIMSKQFNRSFHRSFSSKFVDTTSVCSEEELASSNDDVIVHVRSIDRKTRKIGKKIYNPHFEMFFCNESETDMIKWNSKYKKKAYEISASDQCSKKAELLTKQIAHEFYEWWISVGSPDYKSEIKGPNDLESLFQIWFDEHASRGLVLDPKVLPCVLQSVANAVGVPEAACLKGLKRQIAWDIHAETSPPKFRAFNTTLPMKSRHIPPQNNTAQTWRPVNIPEDLKTMGAIWEDITHLTSTKSFTKWLQQRPFLPMPPCLKELTKVGEKKQLFVVPSDIYVRDRSMEVLSGQELNIPVSQFQLELKEVLSKLLND